MQPEDDVNVALLDPCQPSRKVAFRSLAIGVFANRSFCKRQSISYILHQGEFEEGGTRRPSSSDGARTYETPE